MKIDLQKEESYLIISIEGELDASSSIKLDKVLQSAIDEGNKVMFVDCQNLDYISSSGLGVFTSKIEDFKDDDIVLILYGMQEKVFNVFKILGLDQLIPIVNSKVDAQKLSNVV